jgi:integral membrane protein
LRREEGGGRRKDRGYRPSSFLPPPPSPNRSPHAPSWFRTVALVEATSFVLLLVATAVKYGLDHEEGVQLLGPIHGVLFLVYVGMAMIVWRQQSWSVVTLLIVLAGAVLPLGGYYVERRYLS